MGWRAIKLPNGKYGRFSEVVDDFTHLNYTRLQMRKELIAQAQKEVEREADAKLDRADENPQRFEKALGIVREVHGETRVAEITSEIDDTF